jgi:NSS family neurotransmitter:Na+ symporter
MATGQKKEAWNSRLGVILAVAGSAVGLGNFLRFPGQVVKYGGEDYIIMREDDILAIIG